MAKVIQYKVQEGDTIRGIAKQYLGNENKWIDILNVNPEVKSLYHEMLCDKANTPLPVNKQLYLGEPLNTIYNIKEKETLIGIARTFLGDAPKWKEILHSGVETNEWLKNDFTQYAEEEVNRLIHYPNCELTIPVIGDTGDIIANV